MGGFSNYLATKLGVLTIAALRSANYIPGSAGWQISKSGSSEFNDATVRGLVKVASSTGAYVLLDPSTGKITIQNALAGYQMVCDGGSITMTTPSSTANPMTISVQDSPQALILESPGNGTNPRAEMKLYAATAESVAYMQTPGDVGLDPVAGSAETWHIVSLPAGMTGTIRVRISSMLNFAILDINVTITSTSTTAGAYGAGSLPSSAYYPSGNRQYDLSVNQQFTAAANASPRINIPVSGAINLDMPGFDTAGNSCIVSGTVIYPLD